MDVPEAIRAIGRVPGIGALELNYPQHLVGLSEAALAALLAETGLPLTAFNLRFDDAAFVAGAFTNPAKETRERAVRLAEEAVVLAGRFEVPHVVLWMEGDGFDYPFQADYGRLWSWEIEGFRRVARADERVRVSVEYKPSEPRRYALIRTMGDALLAARDVGSTNFGVTLDICHALMTGEHPPAAAAFALREGRLFGVHLNDGTGWGDDGLMAGSVRPWLLLELLAVLREGGYEGTLYFDTFPVREDAVAECASNARAVRRFEALLDRLDLREVAEIHGQQDAVEARAMLD
ncbi:MAG: sugar phosphate isomerase/epimerase, partial [Chloroflexota bacterium]|nr:sugar phosphate isomerase/epimerase [Chloroflexota bacterium]